MPPRAAPLRPGWRRSATAPSARRPRTRWFCRLRPSRPRNRPSAPRRPRPLRRRTPPHPWPCWMPRQRRRRLPPPRRLPLPRLQQSRRRRARRRRTGLPSSLGPNLGLGLGLGLRLCLGRCRSCPPRSHRCPSSAGCQRAPVRPPCRGSRRASRSHSVPDRRRSQPRPTRPCASWRDAALGQRSLSPPGAMRRAKALSRRPAPCRWRSGAHRPSRRHWLRRECRRRRCASMLRQWVAAARRVCYNNNSQQ